MRRIHAVNPSIDTFGTDNFKLLRLMTALVVAATHSLWVVYGLNPSTQWPYGFLMQASHCGICIFFGLSGYLIAQSLINRPDLFRFLVARFLRICPLLFVASVVMAFVVGPLITEVSFTHYYGDFRLWAYVPFSTFAYPDMTLPGVFVNAPSESEVNISLWTLRYEMIAYLAMTVLAGIGLLSYRLLWVLGLVGGLGYFVITYLTPLRAEIPFVDHGLRFGFAFLMGVLLFRYRAVIPLKIWGVALVIGLAVLTNSTSYMEPFRIIALTYTALWFATGVHPWLSSYNRMGDFSYGVFVFHWPIAQLVLHFNPTISYPELLINVLPLAFLMAVISWYGIERPLLSSKDSLAWRLRYIGRELRAFGRLAIEVMTVYPDEEQRDLRQPHPKRALDEPAVRHEGPVSEVGLPPRPYPARVVTSRNGRPH